MIVYRVLSRIESKFDSLDEAQDFCRLNSTVQPSVPKSAAPGEDTTTPQSFTSIGVIGVFRRCCSGYCDAKSYAVAGNEAYPIIIQSFEVDPEDIYKPTKDQVPDVEETRELWLLKEAEPFSTELCWLDMFSIQWVGASPPTVDYTIHL